MIHCYFKEMDKIHPDIKKLSIPISLTKFYNENILISSIFYVIICAE